MRTLKYGTILSEYRISNADEHPEDIFRCKPIDFPSIRLVAGGYLQGINHEDILLEDAVELEEGEDEFFEDYKSVLRGDYSRYIIDEILILPIAIVIGVVSREEINGKEQMASLVIDREAVSACSLTATVQNPDSDSVEKYTIKFGTHCIVKEEIGRHRRTLEFLPNGKNPPDHVPFEVQIKEYIRA